MRNGLRLKVSWKCLQGVLYGKGLGKDKVCLRAHEQGRSIDFNWKVLLCAKKDGILPRSFGGRLLRTYSFGMYFLVYILYSPSIEWQRKWQRQHLDCRLPVQLIPGAFRILAIILLDVLGHFEPDGSWILPLPACSHCLLTVTVSEEYAAVR